MWGINVDQIKNYKVATVHPLEVPVLNNFHNNRLMKQNAPIYVRQNIALDTPSTRNGITRNNLAINSIAQKGENRTYDQKSSSRLSRQTQNRNEKQPKILSIKEIREEEMRVKQRVMSQGSVDSHRGRKIFVSISKANNRTEEKR